MTRLTRAIKCDCQRCRHKLDNTFAKLEAVPVYKLFAVLAGLVVLALTLGIELK